MRNKGAIIVFSELHVINGGIAFRSIANDPLKNNLTAK